MTSTPISPMWNHQKIGASQALAQDSFAFFAQPGTGKSRTTITVLRHLYARQGHLKRTLIVSPIVTLMNWRDEFLKFSRIDPSHILVLQGTGEQKFKRFVKFVRDEDNRLSQNRIIITNYEAMQNKKLHAALLAWRPEILVCDESHRVKNPRGKRAEKVCEIADVAQHKYILTGTPILNSSQDVFFQYRIMDGGKTFGDNFWAFRNKYFVDKNAWMAGRQGYFPDWQEREELRGEISRKMYFDDEGRPRAHRVLKEECIDLPPMVRVKIKVELSPDQKKMYEEMKKEFLTYVAELKTSDKPLAVVANMAVTKVLRLQQITCGFVKAEDDKEYPIKDNPRLEALKDLLEDVAASGKVIVWACWKQNYEDIKRVCTELGLGFAELHGGIDDKESEIQKFKNDPKCQVMIANQKSGGIGINLVEAPVSIFYSRNFSLEEDIQAEARNYRGGSHIHKHVTRYDIICENSLDELIAGALETKQNIADSILDIKL